jgi:hypothetical protein
MLRARLKYLLEATIVTIYDIVWVTRCCVEKQKQNTEPVRKLR